MDDSIIIAKRPPPPLNHWKKIGMLCLKGLAVGGLVAHIIAIRKYNIKQFIDYRRYLTNTRFLNHTKIQTLIGAGKGLLGGLFWYVLYYQILDCYNHPRDQARIMMGYTVMGAVTISVIINPSMVGLGAFTGAMIGAASIVKSIGRESQPLGMQVIYKEVDAQVKKKTLKQYNLRILGVQPGLLSQQYTLPTR